MPFRVPPGIGDSVDRWCGRYEERRRTATAPLDAASGSAEQSRQEARERHSAEAPTRRKAAHTILEWVDFLHTSGLIERLMATGLRALPLFGPFTRDARPTWHHGGARWYELRLDRPPVLVEHHRQGPSWGRTTCLDTEELIARTVPTPICLHIAKDVDGGTVWNHLRDALIAGEV